MQDLIITVAGCLLFLAVFGGCITGLIGAARIKGPQLYSKEPAHGQQESLTS